MKTRTVARMSVGLILAALPLVGGCVQESSNASPATIATTNFDYATTSNSVADSSAVITPGATEREIETAPGTIISTPQAPPPNATLAAPAAEVARLAQSGLDENVMLAFVTNSTSTFNLGTDQIIYLNDIGVPGNVVAAMLQHDQGLKLASTPPPTYASTPVQPVVAAPETSAVQPEPTPTVAETAPPPQANVTYTYFYDSLAPYGNWIEIEGYGRCWQPSAYVADRGWTPYCHGGRWVYSDCGWYWASDYSWGWAPFHYGRWFRHSFWGWCWAPDTCWGPAWVSWRYSPGYCGWAPLPPSACFRPGFGFSYYGRSVGVSFGFGLGADCFTFVSAGHFCDPHPFHHRVPPHDVGHIFNGTTVINPVVDKRDGERFHRGIPPKQIAEATHMEIKPVKIHEVSGPPADNRGEHHDRDRGTLTVFRPRMPEPAPNAKGNLVGEGVKAAPPGNGGRIFNSDSTPHRAIPRQTVGTANIRSPEGNADNTSVHRMPLNSPRQSDSLRNGSAGATRATPAFGNQARSGRDEGNAAVDANTKDAPLNSLILRGRPDTTTQPRIEQRPRYTERQTPPQNNLAVSQQPQQFNNDTPQNNVRVFQGNQSAQREQPMVHQATPRYQQPREERTFTQPAPVPRQQESRIIQSPPQTIQKGSSPSFNQVPQRSIPTTRTEPAYTPPTPRVETRQATPSVQAPQPTPRANPNANSGQTQDNSRPRRMR